jgi:formyltetrahydrofolate hydrolase
MLHRSGSNRNSSLLNGMSSANAILQLICPDRPGLESELSGWVAANGGNIVHADTATMELDFS